MPGTLLVFRGYDQLKWESFRRRQLLAQDLSGHIDRLLADLVRTKENRPPGDCGFLASSGDPGRPEAHRSPERAQAARNWTRRTSGDSTLKSGAHPVRPSGSPAKVPIPSPTLGLC